MKTRKRSGQSLTEFAIVLPLFLILVLGIIDLGRVIYAYSSIHNAAREGARYGAVHHCDTPGIINATRNLAVVLGDAVAVTIQKLPSDANPERILVTASYDFSTVTPLVGSFLGNGGTITLSSQSRQHIEQQNPCP